MDYPVAVIAWIASYPIPLFAALRQQRQEKNDRGMMLATREQSFIRLVNFVPGLLVLLGAKRT